MGDGRVTEELQDNYNPARDAAFDAEKEIASLRETIRHVEERTESPELTKALRREALGRGGGPGGGDVESGADESAAAAGARAGRRSGGGACDGAGWRVEEEPAALGAESV